MKANELPPAIQVKERRGGYVVITGWTNGHQPIPSQRFVLTVSRQCYRVNRTIRQGGTLVTTRNEQQIRTLPAQENRALGSDLFSKDHGQVS